MDTNDVTTQLLISIRDEVRGTNTRIDRLDGRMDGLEGRMDRLERRQVDVEIRLSTEIVGLAGVVRDLRDTFREDRASRVRLDDHERRITALEKKQS